MMTVCEFRKIIGKLEFSDHFSKIVTYYKQKEYDIDVIKQSVSLTVNPITADNFDYLFNYTPVDRSSDSVIATTEKLYIRWSGMELFMSVSRLIGVQLVFFFFFFFASVFQWCCLTT